MSERGVYLTLLVVISVVNSVGQVMMRWGGSQAAQTLTRSATHYQWLWDSRWWLLGMLVTWVCGLGWALCLRRLPLVVALPIYSGLVYVLSVLGGAGVLKERMSSLQTLGLVCVLVGIFLLMARSAPQPGAPSMP